MIDVPRSRFSLSQPVRRQRADLLTALYGPSVPLRLSPAGLQLLLNAGTRRQRRPDLPTGLGDQLDELIRVGLADADGLATPAAQAVIDAVEHGEVRLRIEATRGRTFRIWQAWLGAERTFIAAQPSPALVRGDTAESVAADDRAPDTAFDITVAHPGWVPIAAARWAGVTPRQGPIGTTSVPHGLLDQRMTDPEVALPRGADAVLAAIWREPLVMWGVDTVPGAGALLIMDAGRAGLWGVGIHEETATLTSVSPRVVWTILLRLIADAYLASRAAGSRGASTVSPALSAERRGRPAV